MASLRLLQAAASSPMLYRTTSSRLPLTLQLRLRSQCIASSRQIISRNASTSTSTNAAAASEAAAPLPSPRRKLRWYWKTLIGLGVLLGGSAVTGVLVDRYAMGGVMQRSLRAYLVLASITSDYKMHTGENPILGRLPMEVLHERNAPRVCSMIKDNGGLYLKAGQAIAVQGNVLPDAYQREFTAMFDDAMQMSWSDTEAVIKEDFGRSVEEVFGEGFELKPRASASIAQVHYAKLADGREVAIKIQKRQIAAQVGWDLWTFKILTGWIAELTKIPMQNLGSFVMDNVMLETDFENEGLNSVKMAEFIEADPRFRDRVYIPKYYPELSTKRVMTTEWIRGAKLWDKDIITGKYDASADQSLGTAGMGLNGGEVMQTVIDFFSSQMFQWGFVHCDPHPGNMFVRRLPSGKPQVVLIDHGLYVTLNSDLRRQYARFWRALLTADQQGLNEVAEQWGMKDANPWADIFLSREKKAAKVDPNETPEERSKRLIDEAGAVFGEDGLWPQEIMFLERNLGIVQGSNRFYGSPVNRIGLIGRSAMRSLCEDQQETFRQTMWSRWVLFILDAVFYISRAKQFLGYSKGFEEELKEAEDRAAKELKGAMDDLFGTVEVE